MYLKTEFGILKNETNVIENYNSYDSYGFVVSQMLQLCHAGKRNLKLCVFAQSIDYRQGIMNKHLQLLSPLWETVTIKKARKQSSCRDRYPLIHIITELLYMFEMISLILLPNV